ncbi:hypothetical protein ACJRO7_008770 [Eucalyptus globulus]|uniref:Pentatricopeptide repeat-containing protein n=1 Tax=Eucalyptus globulus TaxID=34317 RepID=A0ABD3IS94_EUCGL
MRVFIILPSSHSFSTTITTTLSLPPPHHHHHHSTRPPSLNLHCPLPPCRLLLRPLMLNGDGHLNDFAVVADHMVTSRVEVSLIIAKLDVELALQVVEKLGITPAKVIEGAMMDLLGKECARLMDCNHVKSLVQVMEILAGFIFLVRESVKPIRALLDQRSPNLGIRYACIFPHAQILVCTIIHEFGKKGDLASAWKAYEACKKSSNGPNMFALATASPLTFMSLHQGSQPLKVKFVPLDSAKKYLPMQNSGQMALQIKDDMLHAGITPNTVTWSSQINACAKAGLVDQAIQFFEEMFLAGCKPNSECYNILLHACDEAYQFDRAFCLFQPWKDRKVAKTSIGDHAIRKQSLVSKVRQKENSSHAPENASKTHHTSFAKRYPFSPTTTTHNILMKACGNDYHRAKALMEEMKAAGLTPNHISWSILIDLCGGSGNLLKMMRAAKIQPDVIAYATAIKVCVDDRQLKLAFSLYEEIKSCLCILLTKAWNNFGEVEARIVVLAVNVLIILRVSELNAKPINQRSEFKDVIVKLLKNELGIDVLLIETRSSRHES